MHKYYFLDFMWKIILISTIIEVGNVAKNHYVEFYVKDPMKLTKNDQFNYKRIKKITY